MGKVLLGLVLLAVIGSGFSWRTKRQVVITQRQPISDRSVYARRNFAHPDVVSDIYEVYVGPSTVPAVKREAVVLLNGNKGVEGVISFRQERPDTPVFLNGTITGLTPGLHGFHIHMTGDLRQGCASAAGHFNPYMQPHGSPQDRSRHIGDLGNIMANAGGVAEVMLVDPLISLTGVNSILGRSVVVHEKEDDLGRGGSEDSIKTGNAGGRLACGVIGLA